MKTMNELIRENEQLKRVNIDLTNHINMMDDIKVEILGDKINLTINDITIYIKGEIETNDIGFCYICLDEEKKLCKLKCKHLICFECIVNGMKKGGFNLSKKCGMCRRNLSKKIYFKVIR